MWYRSESIFTLRPGSVNIIMLTSMFAHPVESEILEKPRQSGHWQVSKKRSSRFTNHSNSPDHQKDPQKIPKEFPEGSQRYPRKATSLWSLESFPKKVVTILETWLDLEIQKIPTRSPIGSPKDPERVPKGLPKGILELPPHSGHWALLR